MLLKSIRTDMLLPMNRGCVERKHTLLIDHVNELREAIRKVKHGHGFGMDACVISLDQLPIRCFGRDKPRLA